MTSITCPICGHSMTEPAATIATVNICPSCGGSFVLDDDGPRAARAVETTALSPEDLQALRAARGTIARRRR